MLRIQTSGQDFSPARFTPALPVTSARRGIGKPQTGNSWTPVLLNPWSPWTGLRRSLLAHALLVLVVYQLDLMWVNQPIVGLPRAGHVQTLDNYQLSVYLPPVGKARLAPSSPVRAKAQVADPEYAAQQIVSIHADHSSRAQTVIQPDLKLAAHDIQAPNLVSWAAAPVAPTLSGTNAWRELNIPEQQVIQPAASVQSRDIGHLTFLAFTPDAVPPAEAVAGSHRPQMVPVNAPQIVPPATGAASRSVSLLAMPGLENAPVPPAREVAQQPVIRQIPSAAPDIVPPAEQPLARKLASARMMTPAQGPVPPPSPVTAGLAPQESRAVAQLIVLNAHPVPPPSSILVPEGSRKGEFAAGPEGRPGATAHPEVRQGNQAAEPAEHVFVAAAASATPAPAIVGLPPVFDAPQPKAHAAYKGDIPLASESSGIPQITLRQYYPMVLSVPNFSSSSGSWKFRFVRSDPGDQESDFSGPGPLQQVDPAYSTVLVQDHVEGIVLLHATIREDGTVSDVRVLQGADSRLDENVRVALTQWRFRPALRRGVPVSVEAEVSVTCRVPHRQ